MSPWLWIAVGLVGGIGTLGRFWLDAAVSARTSSGLPFGTFAVNLSGAALLGLLVGLGARGGTLLLVGSGLLGAYTTFSTWMLEAHRLAEEGELVAAALNLILSAVAGLAAAAAARGL